MTLRGACCVLLLFLNCSLLTLPAHAQPPSMINYQGRLVDGTNLVNGTVGIWFRIHDDPVAKSILYEATNLVTVVDGLYSTVIGEYPLFGNLDGALQHPELWLEVLINENVLEPRERILSVPYARQVHGLQVHPSNQAITLNPVGGNEASAAQAVVGGGGNNEAQGMVSVVAGGSDNTAVSTWSTVGGGWSNVASGALGTIPGGDRNFAVDNAFAAGRRAKANHTGSFVWGDSTDADVVSTANNQVTFRANGGFRVLGGPISGDASGLYNFPFTYLENLATNVGAIALVAGNQASALYSVAIGGSNNVAAAMASTIGGGEANTVASGSSAAGIASGRFNIIAANSTASAIGGGSNNEIRTNATFAVIAGGTGNIIGNGAFYSAVGGGILNQVGNSSPYTTIGGGVGNQVAASRTASTIAGGQQNQANASFVAIGGGWTNVASESYATVAGGQRNTASGTDSSVLGGALNRATALRTSVGGGGDNEARGEYGTIPGGHLNAVTNYAFAAGRRAKAIHPGSFVWADSTNADFSSITDNEAAFRANGGMRVVGSSGSLMIESSSTSPAYLRFKRSPNSSTDHYIAVDSSDTMLFRLDGATRMRVQSNGNVGIGTASAPTNRLQVVGSANVTGNAGVGGNMTVGGDMTVAGTLRNPAVPILTARVNDNGSIVSGTGTNFITITKNPDYHFYYFNCTHPDYNAATAVIQVTPLDNARNFYVFQSGGAMFVEFFNFGGDYRPCPFMLTIYAP